MRMPTSIDICWMPTMRPRMREGASSARNTHTWDDVMPTFRSGQNEEGGWGQRGAGNGTGRGRAGRPPPPAGLLLTGETADDPPAEQLRHVLRAALHRGANHPDHRGDLERAPAAEDVGDEARADGADERAGRHGGGDLSRAREPPAVYLQGQTGVGSGHLAAYSSLQSRAGRVEVVEVLVGADPGAHRADVEAEEGAADGAKGGEDCAAEGRFVSAFTSCSARMPRPARHRGNPP